MKRWNPAGVIALLEPWVCCAGSILLDVVIAGGAGLKATAHGIVEEELLLMLLEQEKMKMVEKEKLFWDTAGLRSQCWTEKKRLLSRVTAVDDIKGC